MWTGRGTYRAPELDGIGAGQANTTAIVTALGYNGSTDYSATLADDLVHEGYTDWFLPSKVSGI
jgi:hypothetical protein